MNDQDNNKEGLIGELENISFYDFFNLADVQHLQDLFAEAQGVASIITDPAGKPLTRPSNFTRLCENVIRKTEKGCANCFQSDAVIGRYNPSGPIVQTCLSGGLWDAGVSITVGGKHIANWLIGQVRNKQIDEHRMLQYADEIGADKADFMAALSEVPVMSSSQFHKIADLLFVFVNELSGKAYSNMQLSRQITEKEKAHKLLLEQEDNLSTMLYSIGDGIISTDNDGLIIQMNPVAEMLCGWQLSEAAGKPLSEVYRIVNEETLQAVADPVKKVLENDEMSGLANHAMLISRNGTKHQIFNGAAPIKNNEGEITGVVLVFSDVTENYAAQIKVKESEERYRSLMFNLDAGIVVHAPDTSIVMNNARASELLGLSNDQIRGKAAIDPAWKFIHEDNSPLHLDEYPIKRIVNGMQPIKNQVLGIHQPNKNDIVWVTVNGFPVLDEKGEITEIVISFLDITERKHLEKIRKIEYNIATEAITSDNVEQLLGFVRAQLNQLFDTTNFFAALHNPIKNTLKTLHWADQVDDFEEWDAAKSFSGYVVRTGKTLLINKQEIVKLAAEQNIPITGTLAECWLGVPLVVDKKAIGVLVIQSYTDTKAYDASSAMLFEQLAYYLGAFIEKNKILQDLNVAKLQTEENEAYLLSVLQSNNDIIVSRDLNNNVVFFNKAFDDITMELFNQHAFVGMNTLNLLPAEGKIFWENILQTVKNGETHEEEYRYTTLLKTADYLTLHVPVFNGSEVVGTLEITKDITAFKNREDELKQAKDQAEANEAKYRLSEIDLLEAQRLAHIGSWHWDLKTGLVEWSKELYNINGHNPDIPVPVFADMESYYTVESWKTINEAVAKTFNTGEPYNLDFEMVKPDGTIIFTNTLGCANYDEAGEMINLHGTVQDITERKLYEEKLKESLSLLRIAGEKLKLGGWNVNLKENRSYWSDEVAAIHEMPAGYTPLVQDGINFYAPEWRERIIKVFTDCAQQGIPYDEDMEIITASGKRVWINTVGEAVKDDNGNIFKVQGAFQDISGRKKGEEALIAAMEHAEQSDHLKSAFLANMSHEIRTPMNGILGFAELLKEPGLSGEQQNEYIQIIEKSGVRMLNIINDIIDISKIEAGLMKLDIMDSNINEQIDYIYTFFKPEVEAKGLKFLFKKSIPAKEFILATDREKVYAILTNLVKNAIKYTVKGSIEFGYDLVETRHALSLPGMSVQFFVKDTGVGIPKDRQQAIFERFIQAEFVDKMARQGAGLGLSISKAYIEMLGGKIWVESEVGLGSCFYFTLPYHHAEPKEEPVSENSTSDIAYYPAKKLKILIAEDDEVSEMLITIDLKKFSKNVLKARTGHEAVELSRNNPDIDLILMDIQMPVMDGYEATRQIREFNKEVVIIAQTAYGLSGDREKSIEAGCTDYISKPISKDKLLSLIYKYFNK